MATLEPPLHLQPAAQDLGDAPGLRDAAAREERRLGVEDFADLPDAGFVEVLIEAREQVPQLRAIDARKLQLRVDVRARSTSAQTVP